MGYLINDNFLNKKAITIPEADVQIMDSLNPYLLIPTNNLFYVIPVICYFTIDNNQTTVYNGFNHLHLTNSGNFGVGDLCATFSENATASGLGQGIIFSMLVNGQAVPNTFGGYNSNKDIYCFFDSVPTNGDGDMILTIYYLKINI